MRIGYGEDAHRLIEGRPLRLGGVAIPSERGPLAHSDGDALLHALTDALLAAIGEGDIGALFPDDDPENKNRPSRDFLRAARERAEAAGYRVIQVSAVVILDRPKLGPYRDPIRASVAELLGISPDRVGLSFKTSEGLAPDHVQARAVVLLLPLHQPKAPVPKNT